MQLFAKIKLILIQPQCSMAYHHFEFIEETTRILSTFLHPGGMFIVADYLKSDDYSSLLRQSKHKHVVAHEGFDETSMRDAFDKAFLQNFTFRPCAKITMKGKVLHVLLATGTKSV